MLVRLGAIRQPLPPGKYPQSPISGGIGLHSTQYGNLGLVDSAPLLVVRKNRAHVWDFAITMAGGTC